MASYVSNVKPVMSGVREVLKSSGVLSMLESQAQKAAARCNSLYSGHPSSPSIAPYGSKGVQRGYTAGGLVYTATELGAQDNLRNNTLKKGCGV